jgi:branched-chain amino acid transport system substrate-binding protein
MGGERWRWLLAGTAALAVIVGMSAPISAGASVAKSDSSSTIKIGLICSCTGALASTFAPGPPALQAWASSVNAAGGINGHHIQIISKDDALNSGTSLSEVEALISQHVVAIVDSSNEDSSWATYATSHKVPVISGGVSSSLFETNSDFFSPSATSDTTIPGSIAAIKKAGLTDVGMLYCAEAPICGQLVAPLRTIAAKDGVSVKYVASISASAPSYAGLCLAAKQAGVTALAIETAGAVIESAATQCSQQGYDPVEVAGAGTVEQSFASTPGIEEHLVGYENDIPFFVTDTPGTKKFRSALLKYAPSAIGKLSEDTVLVWDAGLLIGTAIKAEGSKSSVTSQEVIDGIYTIHHNTLGGMAIPLTFKKGVPNPQDCWYWIDIKNGKFGTPYGLTPYCEK